MQSLTPPAGTSATDFPWLRFVSGFLAHPSQVASICPSSRRLQRKIAALPSVRRAGMLVELGPGLGETTRALLDEMPARARLLAIEIVPEFVRQLRAIQDPRLAVVQGSALDLGRLLDRCEARSPDVIVCGIPFSAMSPSEGRDLVDVIHTALAPGGSLIVYQFRDRIRNLAAEFFGAPQVSFVLGNLPPLRIYEWTKPDRSESSPHRRVDPPADRRTAES